MRFIREHSVHRVDELVIWVVDEPGSGGANHEYAVEYNPVGKAGFVYNIGFQNGAIQEVGINGLTNEALLAIVADRLKNFQAGPFACDANGCALHHTQEALHWLQQRTLDRIRRGVEGVSVA